MDRQRLARAFLAVDPDTVGRGALLDLQHVLQRELPVDVSGWTRRHDLHLTLQFFGDIDRTLADGCLERLAHATADIPPFDLLFSRVEYWPSVRPRLAVAVFESSEPLDELRARVNDWARSVALEPDPRPFVPHVTLLRSGRPLSIPATVSLAAFRLHCKDVALMHRAAVAGDHYARHGHSVLNS